MKEDLLLMKRGYSMKRSFSTISKMSLPSSLFRLKGLYMEGKELGREICFPSRLPPVFNGFPSPQLKICKNMSKMKCLNPSRLRVSESHQACLRWPSMRRLDKMSRQREDRGVKTGGRWEGQTNIPPVDPALYIKAFRAKKGGREGNLNVR